tara:strand:+ start:1097 stop:1354 length:258 start_codon:yes stop_codon:yes gene_type:complete
MDIEKLKEDVNKLKDNKVEHEEFELSNFQINERIDLLEKLKNAAPTALTDVASTMAFNPSTVSNNGANDDALSDLANKLANLQKQ